MKKHLFTILAILVISQLKSQTICIQRGTDVLTFTRLDTAVAHSQNGDCIYLPGGPMPTGSTIVINKQLTIIGCGYNLDSTSSTGQTLIAATLYFQSGAGHSSITGIYLSGQIIIYTSDITVSRCNASAIYLNSNNMSNIYLLENIIRSTSSSIYSSSIIDCINLVVSKNIISGSISSISSGGLFINNLFLLNTSSYVIGFNLSFCTFQNNIFMHPSGNFYNTACCQTPASNNYFQNNLFTADLTSVALYSNTLINCIFSEPASNIFVNASGTTWSPSQNYHLKSTCAGIGNGTDGTDIGIYGSSQPFKDGGLPYNPHYLLIDVPPAINSSTGTLNVNFQVETQDR